MGQSLNEQSMPPRRSVLESLAQITMSEVVTAALDSEDTLSLASVSDRYRKAYSDAAASQMPTLTGREIVDGILLDLLGALDELNATREERAEALSMFTSRVLDKVERDLRRSVADDGDVNPAATE